MDLNAKLEAILFWKGEPVSRKKLGEILKISIEEVDAGLVKLKESCVGRGMVLIEKDDQVVFGTATEFAELIENLQKEEINKDLSKAALETWR